MIAESQSSGQVAMGMSFITGLAPTAKPDRPRWQQLKFRRDHAMTGGQLFDDIAQGIGDRSARSYIERAAFRTWLFLAG